MTFKFYKENGRTNMNSASFTFCVPCLFGLEGLAAEELRRLDLQNVRAEDGRVFFSGGPGL